MIKDFLISFKDNLKEKTRNPFLGTYLIIWIVRNWELIYTLFNFDKTTNLIDKIEFIKLYYTENDFLINLLTNILWAFGLLVLTYLLLNLSRLIINISDKHITPWIYSISDSKSIVLKETYDLLKNEKFNLELKLEKERENKAKLQKEILSLENKLDEIYLKNIENIENNESKESNEKIELSTNEELEKNKDSLNILFSKVESKNLSNEFLSTILQMDREEGWIEDALTDPSVDYFAKLGLLNVVQAKNGFTRYEKTEEGNEVLKRIRLTLE